MIYLQSHTLKELIGRYYKQKPKEFWFWKSSKSICIKKILDKICMTAWASSPTAWASRALKRFGCLSGPECLSALSRLSSLTLFQKSILNHLKFKTKPILLIAQQSLICHKPNLFRRTYDFLVWWTITLDLQWRVSHYLKRLLLPNIKKGTKLPTYK